MKKMLLIFISLSILIVLIAPLSAQPTANLTDTCVENYDPAVDYFPAKATLQDAEKFTVEYFNNYKVVTVLDAFDSAPLFDYVLVQCGTPAPDAADFPEGTQFIDVPTGNVITLSTTELPHLDELGLLDHLIGLDSFEYVNTAEVRQMIDAGEMAAVGFGAEINVELVLDLGPDLVLTYGYDPASDAHPVLLDAGIFTAIIAEWREPTPLGRAEWLKYTALFYNAEADAETIYKDIVSAYEEARQLTASIPDDDRPQVLWNRFSPFTDSWAIPGMETYAGALIHDAGGRIALGEQAGEENLALSFETVFDGAFEADVWIVNAFGMNTFDDLLAADSRFGDFTAAQAGNVWNNTLDVNEFGGNNYFELGVTHPHLILQDLVAIFHSDLLPDHEFHFYRRLERAS